MTRTIHDREHERELQKHEWRPGDNPVLGKFTEEPLHRFDKPIATAVDVAALVRALPNIADAANLIEQYAQTVAAGARLEAVETTSNRILDAIGGAGK